jgi:hypothetical protein
MREAFLSQLGTSAPLYDDAAIRRLSLRHKEDSMVVRSYAVACIALAFVFLGGTGAARAGDDYSSPQSGDTYSAPDAGEHPAQSDDGSAPPPEDDSATAPDDNGGDDSGDDAPPSSDQPE